MTDTTDLNVSAALDADQQCIERRRVFAEPSPPSKVNRVTLPPESFAGMRLTTTRPHALCASEQTAASAGRSLGSGSRRIRAD
jgi:hypothetical protein